MRKAYVRIKLPEELCDFVSYVVVNRLLGYRSMIEFVSAATREKIHRMIDEKVVPPAVPRVRTIPRGAIGNLNRDAPSVAQQHQQAGGDVE